MRTQRRAPVTVTLVHVTATDDGLGNVTETTMVTPITGATFDPERILEQAENNRAAVVRPATFNLPGVHDIDANDQVLIGDVAEEDLAEYAGVTWYVVGGGAVWLDRTKVPVTQTRES